MRFILGSVVLMASLAGCQAEKASTELAFLSEMKTLCDQTLTGQVVSDDPQDADWRGKVLTVGPVECADNQMVMPLAVGDDTSRVWTVAYNEEDLTLSHAHTLKDGSPDPVTGYGGTAQGSGTAARQDFPVDQYSIDVFKANGLEASVTNIWSMEIKQGDVFAYELNRKGRHFRAEFPLKSAE